MTHREMRPNMLLFYNLRMTKTHAITLFLALTARNSILNPKPRSLPMLDKMETTPTAHRPIDNFFWSIYIKLIG